MRLNCADFVMTGSVIQVNGLLEYDTEDTTVLAASSIEGNLTRFSADFDITGSLTFKGTSIFVTGAMSITGDQLILDGSHLLAVDSITAPVTILQDSVISGRAGFDTVEVTGPNVELVPSAVAPPTVPAFG